jgi:hypothetical protein
MRRPLFRHALAAVVSGCLAACAGHGPGSDAPGTVGSNNSTPACTTIPAPPVSQLPHIAATGANATAIEQALAAIFAAQNPPISPGTTYSIPTLDCGNAGGFGPTGYYCDLQVQLSGGQPISIMLSPPSALAQTLTSALFAAGSMPANLKENNGALSASNMTVSPSGVQYDDASCYAAFDPPNVVAHGADAQAVLAAFAAAGVDDCDPTRYVFLVCSGSASAPSCSTTFMPLQTVGASDLIPLCMGEGETWPGSSFDAASSLAMWQAIQAAAMDAGFAPMSGTLAESNVINARYFTWDGSALTFTLVEGNATPPGDAGGP